jgi:hypothetical protein
MYTPTQLTLYEILVRDVKCIISLQDVWILLLQRVDLLGYDDDNHDRCRKELST